MNKCEVIKMYKEELRHVVIQKEVLEQSLQTITCREVYLLGSLEKLGTSANPRKGKSVLTPKQRTELLASLTK